MSSDIVSFRFEGTAVRGLSVDGEPWFVAKDIADVLGYANPQKAVRDHCKGARPVGVNESFTLDPQTTVIPERDLYRLIMRSKLPAAERFEDWVVGEVLPTIRKTGRYAATVPNGEVPAVLTVPLKEWSSVMSRLIEVQQDLIASLKREKDAKDVRRCEATARMLISSTGLTDAEIAERMKDMMDGSCMPEWVAWQRRKLAETASPS
ncbi:MAG: Bro-N domain-containing protein [Caenispirillum sp.]|nr:Bro-N domain-containing protein [Caenispirillum sp.]